MGIETIQKGGKQMIKNWFLNLPHMNDRSQSSPINALYNANRKRPCIIVAAGPSLNDDIKLLDAFDGVVIAVDTALGPMSKHSAKWPDYVTSVDYSDITASKYRPIALHNRYQHINLIHIPETCNGVVKIPFKNKYFAYHGETYKEAFDELLNVNCGSVWRVTSGSHLALFAAYFMGCDPIALVGHDYQIKGDKSHADGTVNMWPATEKGKAVFMEQLELQQKIIESFTPINKPVVFNCSKGLYIEGTQKAKLAYFIDKYTERKDINATVKEKMAEISEHGKKYTTTKAEIAKRDIDDLFSRSKWAKMTHGIVWANTGGEFFNYQLDTPEMRDFVCTEIGKAAEEMIRLID